MAISPIKTYGVEVVLSEDGTVEPPFPHGTEYAALEYPAMNLSEAFHLFGLLSPIVVFSAVVLLGVIIDLVVLRILRKLTEKTRTKADDVLISAVNRVILFFFLMLALYFMVNATYLVSKFPPKLLKLYNVALLSGIILAVAWVLAEVINHAIDSYVQQFPEEVPTGILKSIVKLTVLTVAFLVALESGGISVTPILTALGVGGLAVALALQDSLSNLFAGLNVIMSRQIRRGDYVKLENGEEGFVEEMTWRNTLIRTIANNIVIVPNSKLASSILINYDLIEKPRGIPVPMGVAYGSDLDFVERVTLEVAREVQRDVTETVAEKKLEEMRERVATAGDKERDRLEEEMRIFERVAEEVKNYEPILRYREFGDSSINFIVVLKALTTEAVFLLRHEFIKRVKRRYDEEGIEIPFPQRDVWFRNWPKS